MIQHIHEADDKQSDYFQSKEYFRLS